MVINPSIFKAYDIRGRYPKELDHKAAAAIARGFAAFLRPKTVVIGRDVRLSGPKLASAVMNALRGEGIDVIDIGVVPADALYFGVVKLKAEGGIYISASHNPRDWNGMNLCRAKAEPISSESGLKEIQYLATTPILEKPRQKKKRGSIRKRDIIGKYLDFVWRLAPIKKPRPLTILLDGNFGVSAQLFRRLLKRRGLPFRLIGLNERPDGRFPKGPPDPLLPNNQRDLERAVKKARANLGIAWDADGDRCFFVDEKGKLVEGYFTTAVLAAEILKKRRRATIIIDPRLTWATRDIAKPFGGRVVVSRPGMTRIAERMKKEQAVFVGEMSGHYYFCETFNRDNGFLPALMMLNIMFREKKTLSEIAAPFRKKYFISGEKNFPLPSRERTATLLKKIETRHQNGKISRVDGLSVEHPRWRFNLRPSNTEPLLRLNVEARDPKTLRRETKKLSKLIKTA